MAKKKCPFQTFNAQVVYCDKGECEAWNEVFECCDPTGLIGVILGLIPEDLIP